MIKTKMLTTLEDFTSLKKGDLLVCEFRLDVSIDIGFGKIKRTRYHHFVIEGLLPHLPEVLLERKNNVYFNYEMFLNPNGPDKSNLKSAIKIYQSID